ESGIFCGKLTLPVENHKGWDTFNAQFLVPITPLAGCHTVMLSFDIWNSFVPCTYGRGFSCKIYKYHILALILCFDRLHCFHGTHTGATPGRPEIYKNYFSLVFLNDSAKHFVLIYIGYLINNYAFNSGGLI